MKIDERKTKVAFSMWGVKRGIVNLYLKAPTFALQQAFVAGAKWAEKQKEGSQDALER